jgi:hypothetical protein
LAPIAVIGAVSELTRRLTCRAMSRRVPRCRRAGRCEATSRTRLLRPAGRACYFVVSELQEITLQSFQRITLLIEVIPQVVGFLEYVSTMVDHALADEG